MRNVIAVAIVAALASVALAGAPARPKSPLTGRITDRSRICMMQDSVQPKAGLKHEYQGKAYWLCCQMCEQSFRADPDRYAHAKDPVTGDLVDKATAPIFAVNGKAYFFSSERTLQTFAKNPQQYLAQ